MTREKLLENWCESVSVMHISHHKAAARCTIRHVLLGGLATFLAAVVGASVFSTLTEYAKNTGGLVTIAVGFISMVSAALTAMVTFLKLDERAGRHTKAAANFQGLRREIEEEIVKLADGQRSENYKAIRDRWRKVIKESPPLPQRIHNQTKKEFGVKRSDKEVAPYK